MHWKNCARSLFLSATKRPFPAAAADDKTFSVPLLFVLGRGSKKQLQHLWDLLGDFGWQVIAEVKRGC